MRKPIDKNPFALIPWNLIHAWHIKWKIQIIQRPVVEGRVLLPMELVNWTFPYLLALQVSWIRKKEYHLLTVGLTTYSSDERFSALHSEDSEVMYLILWPRHFLSLSLIEMRLYHIDQVKHALNWLIPFPLFFLIGLAIKNKIRPT